MSTRTHGPLLIVSLKRRLLLLGCADKKKQMRQNFQGFRLKFSNQKAHCRKRFEISPGELCEKNVGLDDR